MRFLKKNNLYHIIIFLFCVNTYNAQTPIHPTLLLKSTGPTDIDNHFYSFENQKNLTHIKKEDSKKSRSISDKNDTSDNYQIHMIYVLPYDINDQEFDINGKGQQFLDELKKELNKKSNNKIHFDYDENNKHDISFARIPINYSEI